MIDDLYIRRLRNAAVTLTITVIVTMWALWLSYIDDHMGWNLIGVLGFFLVGLYLTNRVWHETKAKTEPPKPVESKITRERRPVEKKGKLEDRWYVRYAVAIAYLVGAIFVVDRNEDLWWVAIPFVLFAIIKAREVTLLLLGAGVLYLIGQGFASLPVGVAIIIGAVIIAGAIEQSSNK